MNNLKSQLNLYLNSLINKLQNLTFKEYLILGVGLFVVIIMFSGIKLNNKDVTLYPTVLSSSNQQFKQEEQPETLLNNSESATISCDFNLMEYGVNGNVDIINECFTKSAYINELGNRVITIINLSETIKIVCAEKNGELLTVVQVTSGSVAVFAPNLKHKLSIDESWMQTEITITDKAGDILTYTFKK